MQSITNGGGDESPTPGEEDQHRDGPDRTPPPKQRYSGGGSQGGRSVASQLDATLEIAQNTDDGEWLTKCLENAPIKLRAKLLDSTPEQMGLDVNWSEAGEAAWMSCQQVANAALAQNNPRLEEADSWIAANFDYPQGSRDYGAARLFHRHCCAHAFGQYTPPEGPPPGTDLINVQPGIQQGSPHPAVRDFGDILQTMGEVMQTQSAANLNLAIDNIAKLLKPEFDATGPTDNAEEKEVQSMEDAEMVSQVLPGLKYMDERMRALEAAAVGVIEDVHLPARRMWGMMEGIKRFATIATVYNGKRCRSKNEERQPRRTPTRSSNRSHMATLGSYRNSTKPTRTKSGTSRATLS